MTAVILSQSTMLPNILGITVHSVFLFFTLLGVLVLVVHLVPYFIDPYHIRSNDIKGPSLAGFSGTWLGWVAVSGHQSIVVHQLHKKFGTFLRLAPNHVSISDVEALQAVYGQGSGTLKSNYYDAFVAFRPSIFETRSKAEHSRKRKAIAHVFSQKSVAEFEPFVRLHLAELFEQWDKMCDGGKKGISGAEGEDGWNGHDGRVWFNVAPWFNYLGFDITGDLAFGFPFGMVCNASDTVQITVDQKASMDKYGQKDADQGSGKSAIETETKEIQAVKVLNNRTNFDAHAGSFPPRFRPFMRRLPRFSECLQSSEDLAGFTVTAVARRLAFPSYRTDILSKLQQSKDEHGKPFSKEEVTSDAQTMLIAGSDTVSNTSSATAYYIAKNPGVQIRLQKELDEAFAASDDAVATYAQIKDLPYLAAVVNEGLRLHAPVGVGLQRVVPKGGLTVCGKWFPEGTILSVPTYTIHRDPGVWGEDADAFRPERWLECDQSVMQKAFNPFSIGPRACIGRNLALMELQLFASSIFHRYEIVLEGVDKPEYACMPPNHVSISDPEALHVVYGHGSRTLKSDYYEVFNSVRPSIFSTRSRTEHARKRKAISHAFSLKSVLEFEPYIHIHITFFLGQLDKLCDGKLNIPLDTEDDMCWEGQGGRVSFDIMPWLNYLAFDIIGACVWISIRYVRNASNTAPVAVDQKACLARRSKIGADTDSFESEHIEVKEIERFSGRTPGEFTVAAVAKRLAFPTERANVLSNLFLTKDEQGRLPSREDLTQDAITQLVAGSDTDSSKSVKACQAPDGAERCKGLPRVIGESGLTVCGKRFPEGTCVSVPSYTIHRDPLVWGEDVDVFRPERWFERDPSIMQNAFNAFSFGPRFYDIILEEPDKSLEIHKTFIRRPIACHIGLKRQYD
ncbi:cytochrome P450 [Fomitiporia mediterranea MF3/22]|uniref:Cytochrome P450 n=1 Tax=Fomitiporia mediterranea (strain MF3/22) TaxID=694068 RepID=R7SFZ9_FOMME|nr:cytochrome P450 [Fomitiporia mediterranea MF3/22]EJC97641.1 cytochrome P450 [Fomitiporia mediterranea MF3/22]